MCRSVSHRHHHRARPAVDGLGEARRDPRRAEGDLDLRVGDREREVVAAALREHAAAGRLTTAELEERLGAALTARSGHDLRAPLADLPRLAPSPAPRDRARVREEARGIVVPWLLVSVLLVALWALTGAEYFWPVWPILGWGIAVWARAAAVLRDGVPRAGAG
jgi:hypothetical protein